ncbi:carbon-nitrogen family hydrolase [Shouchella clausii]|uniref:Carbon-nitrogen family hydrolase n=2 Tax=Bacillaceae TaxID=186817 RepID=A0A268NUF0_SHOCL|nr:carbon-nitrogen family hydrolase [Shouchella clausii]MCZ1184145.1 carbon-nitrogen family hydrolase [Shouchella clausii]PAD45120.1 carbon-nitrogen family hydrolase [Shouchella clausii]PAE86690.1 carbon-nitrogen family hydrolase [Shouchella clausii]PAE91066.1 carbon-nitrogen family hydrolase [Shouchella clausii]PAF07411.1 carbon-nitrogen family hydrolase [Shouchella clausii]
MLQLFTKELKTMHVAVFQMEVLAGKPDQNRERVKTWVEQLCREQLERPLTIVLPELWTTGYQLEDLGELAEEEGVETIAFLQQLARAHRIHMVAGSIATKKDGGIYNTALVIDAQGKLVYTYDKVHLVPMLNEPAYMQGGSVPPALFELDGVKMAVLICYDLRFPELARRLALEGAEVLFIVAEWPLARAMHWKALQQARAIENQFYLLSCNSVGSHNGTDYAGTSMVIDPWGEIIVEGSSTEEEWLQCKVDFSKAAEVRERVPVFSSRRPDLYR